MQHIGTRQLLQTTSTSPFQAPSRPSRALPSGSMLAAGPSAGAAGGGPSMQASLHSDFSSSSRKSSSSDPLEVEEPEEPDDAPPFTTTPDDAPAPAPAPEPAPAPRPSAEPAVFRFFDAPVRRARRLRMSPRAALTAGSRSSLATRSREGKSFAARKRTAISCFPPGPRAATSGSY